MSSPNIDAKGDGRARSLTVPTITTVVVTRDRPELLRRCLEAVANQTAIPGHVVVIDNASGPETSVLLAEEFAWVSHHRLDINVGGAGGFKEGLRVSRQLDSDFVWLLDDDVEPQPGALAALMDAMAADEIDVAASSVVWSDGSPHRMNRPRFRAQHGLYTCGGYRRRPQIRYATFVSLLIRSRVIKEYGLPLADYFIWSDDIEYTARILRHRFGVYVPDSIVTHHTALNSTWLQAPLDRFYFHTRNSLWLLRSHDAFSLTERLFRTASLTLGVTMYVVGHRFSGKALSTLLRAIYDGVTSSPKG